MATGGKRLGQEKPRERSGSETAQRYEFQFQRTAKAALSLLDDQQQYVCVYCDWHDDFVVEVGETPTRYVFHQVKGRRSSQSPWSFREFFGVSFRRLPKSGKKSAAKSPASDSVPAVADGAVFPFMVEHHRLFGESCAGVAFVTNAGFGSDLSVFIKDIAEAANVEALPLATRFAFDELERVYVSAEPSVVADARHLFDLLRSLRLHADQGKLDDEDSALLELGQIIEHFSEIDLLQSESKMIGRQIIGLVRTKAQHSTTTIPAPDDVLRRNKGIVVRDLLNVLSLSADGYEALKSGMPGEKVKTLSRLQRYCQRNGLGAYVVEICGFRAAWETWRTAERHFMTTADYLTLVNRAKGILQAGYKLERMIDEARGIAKQFSGLTATPLTGEHVLGLMFSLAASADTRSPMLVEVTL